MKLFLTKYYLLTKDILPDTIDLQTIENLAKKDVPSIFMAQPIQKNSLTKEQIKVIKSVREQLFQEHDYQANWMAHWQTDFEAKYDKFDTLLSGYGWVTVLQDQVAVRAQGAIWVWRVRTGEKPIAFKNYDGIEATSPNDVWLLTSATEMAQPNEGDLAAEIPLNYAEKLELGETEKGKFDILKIERLIETAVPTTIPTANEVVGQRVLTIAKRMIAANHPFATYEPLLKSLSNHKQLGNEANDLLKKHAPQPSVTHSQQTKVDPKPPVTNSQQTKVDPKPPVTNSQQTKVDPKPPVTNSQQTKVDPKPPVTNSQQTKVDPKPPVTNSQQTKIEPPPTKIRPYIIGGTLILGSLLAYNLNDMRTPQPPREPDIVVPSIKDSSNPKPNLPTPSKPTPTPTVPVEPQPKVTIPPKPIDKVPPKPTETVTPPSTKTKPPVTQSTDYQQYLNNANNLFKDAKENLESYPFNINKALLELHLAEQSGLDAKTYLAKSNEITSFKQNVVAQLTKEADALSQTAKTASNKADALKALKAAEAKWQLEQKIAASDSGKKQLQEVKKQITSLELKSNE
jgi:outer membrane biosynthesis protein TonB